MSRPSTSRLARSPTPDYALDNSGDDVLPLAFDSEDELLDVLARLRDGLVTRARGTWEEKTQGKGGEEGWRAVEGVVGRQFFDSLAPLVLSNCTIAGLPYAQHQLRDPTGVTEPFSEDLHDKVLKYQDEFFVARVENVTRRKELPELAAAVIRKRIADDAERVRVLEEGNKVEFLPREPPAVAGTGKGRKSVSRGATLDAPTAQETQAAFATAKAEVDRMLNDIPVLSTGAESATRVALDAGTLV